MLIIVMSVIHSIFIRLRVFIYKHLLTCIATLVTQKNNQIQRSMEKYVSQDEKQKDKSKYIMEMRQQQNRSLQVKDRAKISRRYIKKKNKSSLGRKLNYNSDKLDAIQKQQLVLKAQLNERKKLKESFRTKIQKVRQILPIVCEQNIQFIGKKGGYKSIWKVPMAEDLLITEFNNIDTNKIKIKTQINKSQHQGQAIVKTQSQNHTENIQMNKGEKQSTRMIAETSQNQQQNNLSEQEKKQKLNYKIYGIKEKNKYLQLCIQQLDKIVKKWNISRYQPQRQPLLGKIMQIEPSQLAGKINQKNIKVNRKPNPDFSEQEQINIQNLSLKYSQLSSQTNTLKNDYCKLLKKIEHILPQISEDQKHKSQKIEVKHPQSSRLVHYASLPMSSKDMYEESARIRAKLHQQFKKNMKIPLSQISQFEKTKREFEIKIKVLYFRREYLQKAIEKIQKYIEDDESPLLQLQDKQIQNNEQLKQVSEHEKCIQRMSLGDEGEVQCFVGQIPEKINVLKIFFHSEKERNKDQKLCCQLSNAQAQNQKLKEKYLHLVSIAQEIKAPFFNEDDVAFIQLKGSKNQQTTTICPSKHSLQRQLVKIDKRQLIIMSNIEKNIKKQWKNRNPSSDQQLNLQKSENDKKAIRIKRMRLKSEFMKESIVALGQYISKWKQIISSQNTQFIKKKEKCLDTQHKQ